MLTNVYFDKYAVVSETNPSQNYSVGETFSSEVDGKRLLLRASAFPSDLGHKEIGYVKFYIYAKSSTSSASSYQEGYKEISYPAQFDPEKITWSEIREATSQSINIETRNIPGYIVDDVSFSFSPFFREGIALTALNTVFDTPLGDYPPYLSINHGSEIMGVDVTPTFPVGAATISKTLDTTFSWIATPQSENTYLGESLQSARFRWRYVGENTYQEVDSDGQFSHIVPANTFESGEIEWQIEATANSGAITVSDWMRVSVTEPTSSATINAPKNAVVDGATELTFSWNHIIANGTKPTGFDLQTSPDGEAWTTLRTVSGSDTSVVIPAGTFTAGDLYWRVRTYNLDSVAGSWSEAAHVIVIAAPAAPGVTVESAEPSFQIRWQQTGQQAYEITLDDQVIAKRYGVETNYQYDGYLEPGTYTIKVRIQNQYSLWSDWGVLSLTIANTEGEAITLTAEGDNDVTLSWNGNSAYSKYIVYRNDVKLGETAQTSIVDHFPLGTVKYQVRGVYADSGNYTLSNVVYVTVTVDTIMIADVDDPVWLRLDKSTSSLRTTSISDARSVTYLHYIGATLPSAEIGEPVSKTYRLDCAWNVEDAVHIAAFERLAGKVVCIKTAQNRRIIGVMGELSSSENCMIVSYQVPITLIDWEDKLQGGDSDDGLPGSESGGSVASMIIDATLTKEGAAAEAKATGDRLSALEKALEGFLDEAAALIGGV